MSELKFSPGKGVEVSLHAEDSLDTWYPATVIKDTGKGSFLVEYNRSDEGGPVQVIVDSLHIRPSPPACVNTTFQLLEKVDAFCNFGWSSGVVTKVLAEGRYIVYFKRTRKEKELRHTDLRLPMVQIQGKWAHSSQDAAADVISNSHESKDNNLGGNGKIGSQPVNSGIVKEREEEVRNGQKEQARIVSSIAIEGETRSKTLHDRTPRKKPRRDKTFKELNAEPVPEELQLPHQVCETQMGETEKVDPSIVKESEVRNDQKEQAITVSSTGIEGDNMPLHDRTTKKKPRRDRTVKELNTEASPKELQSSLQKSEAKMTETEQLDQKEILEVPTSDKANTSLEQSENGKEDIAKSATPGRSLEVPEEKLDSVTKKRSTGRGKGGRGRGRLVRRGKSGRPWQSVPSNPTASVAGGAANQSPIAFAESIQGFIEKPIVISLPCYNSQWNKLQAQGNTKLPIQDAAEGRQDEEKLLPPPVSDEITVNTENHGNPETKGLNKENSTTPKRKRGRPFGSLSGSGKRKVKETDEIVTILSTSTSSRRRSTRERREVYKSAIDSLRPRTKKLRTLSEDSSPTQETEANVNKKPEDVITYNLTEYVEPVSHGVYGNISDQDEDRPLSAWLGEAHSLPNHTKPSSGGNTSQSGKLVARNDQIPTVPHKEETNGGSDVDLAQSASQDEGGTVREREGEKVTDIVEKGLPFSKISPIWKVIESMEVFQQIPQNPHFQPLYETKEHCREGLAICSMVTFSRLADDISKFQFDDPNNILQDSMETLSDLERQGFSVESIKSRLKALLSIKSGHGQAQIMEKEIAEEHKDRAKIDEEIDELDRKIAELREKRELHVLDREEKNSKIGELQLRYDPLKKAMEAARSEFERLINAPW